MTVQPTGIVPAPDQLTLKDVQQAVPAQLKNTITQEFVDQINTIAADPLLAEQIRNNFISYTVVMQDGKFKIGDYLNAVTYVSYKLMGYSNQDAYLRTFPQRHADLVAKGCDAKTISSYVTAYARGKLPNLIMEQSLVPSWVLNQDLHQKAINVQAEIMTDPDVSPKVRTEAANSLLTHLKKPEGKDFQINMNINDKSGLNELKETLRDMAQQQTELMAQGVGVKEIAASPIIEVRANDDSDPN